MSLEIILNENKSKIGIWNIEEDLSILEKNLNPIDKKTIKNKSDKRKKEWIGARLLLNKIEKEATISYNKFGAPKLDNDRYISISHSKKMIAVITSNINVGLDIEEISNKPLLLSSRFINKQNHIRLSKEKATLIWCAKEAIYKWHQKGEINFKKDIQIEPFKLQKTGILTANFKNNRHTLYYKKIHNHFLAYVCK